MPCQHQPWEVTRSGGQVPKLPPTFQCQFLLEFPGSHLASLVFPSSCKVDLNKDNFAHSTLNWGKHTGDHSGPHVTIQCGYNPAVLRVAEGRPLACGTERWGLPLEEAKNYSKCGSHLSWSWRMLSLEPMVSLQLTNSAINQWARCSLAHTISHLYLKWYWTWCSLRLLQAGTILWLSGEHLEFTLSPSVSDGCRQVGMGPGQAGFYD